MGAEGRPTLVLFFVEAPHETLTFVCLTPTPRAPKAVRHCLKSLQIHEIYWKSMNIIENQCKSVEPARFCRLRRRVLEVELSKWLRLGCSALRSVLYRCAAVGSQLFRCTASTVIGTVLSTVLLFQAASAEGRGMSAAMQVGLYSLQWDLSPRWRRIEG